MTAIMRRRLRADLHIHSCLSPCADLTMSPSRIVKTAIAKKLDMIALCDHNSAENVRAAMRAARKTALTVFPGMEVTSSEEVHVCAIFGGHDPAMALQEIVYGGLAGGENDPGLFGEQIVANEFDEVEGYNTRLLIGATNLPVERIVCEIHRLGGLVIASHVDRDAYSIIGQLGFIPPNLELDALEISRTTGYGEAVKRMPQISASTLVTSSDAHNPHEIGTAFSIFNIDAPTIDEIRKAFRKEDGRSVLLEK